MGLPLHQAKELKVNHFCKTLSEFALEYRTTREKVVQQLEKKANQRERKKTRGKMIVDVSVLTYFKAVFLLVFIISRVYFAINNKFLIIFLLVFIISRVYFAIKDKFLIIFLLDFILLEAY